MHLNWFFLTFGAGKAAQSVAIFLITQEPWLSSGNQMEERTIGGHLRKGKFTYAKGW